MVTVPGFAQKLDSAAINRIADKLVIGAIKEFYEKDTVVTATNCVYDEEDFALSCYSAYGKEEWVTDFDADGINDVLIYMIDEGLGGGGNAFGYDYRIVLLGANQNIKKQYSIFGGGKLSLTNLEIDKVKDGKIYATATENTYATRGPGDTSEDATSKEYILYLQDEKLEEAGYSNCKMAEMKDKSIFKQIKDITIKRSEDLNSEYLPEQHESFSLSNGTSFTGFLSGCDKLELSLEKKLPYLAELEKNKQTIKREMLKTIAELKDYTRYPSVLSSLYKELEKVRPSNISLGRYGGSQISLILNDGWTATVFASGNEEQGSWINMNLEK